MGSRTSTRTTSRSGRAGAGSMAGERRDAHVEPVDLRGDLRKLGDGQLVVVGQHDGAEHRVLELAHVARPVVGGEHGDRLRGQAADALALLGGEAGDEPAREIGDVGAAHAQRRDQDREDVEPVVQVLAEQAALHQLD